MVNKYLLCAAAVVAAVNSQSIEPAVMPTIEPAISLFPIFGSCATMRCAEGWTCVDGPAGSKCVDDEDDAATTKRPRNYKSCAATTCPANKQCIEFPRRGARCVRRRSQPLDPQAPTLSCANMFCMSPTQCVETATGPQCITLPPTLPPNGGCAVMLCEEGSRCVEEEIICTNAPCHKEARCVKNSPSLTCAAMTCAQGQECVMQSVRCIQAPCPEMPKCVPVDPSVAQPSCASMICPAGHECIQAMVMCIRAPCPQPPPECVPMEKANPCVTMRCSRGQSCVARSAPCFRAPCEKIGVCINDKIVDDDAAACATVTCPRGQVCEALDTPCFAPPCQKVGTCMTRPTLPIGLGDNSCAAVNCMVGSICVNGQCVSDGTQRRG